MVAAEEPIDVILEKMRARIKDEEEPGSFWDILINDALRSRQTEG